MIGIPEKKDTSHLVSKYAKNIKAGSFVNVTNNRNLLQNSKKIFLRAFPVLPKCVLKKACLKFKNAMQQVSNEQMLFQEFIVTKQKSILNLNLVGFREDFCST